MVIRSGQTSVVCPVIHGASSDNLLKSKRFFYLLKGNLEEQGKSHSTQHVELLMLAETAILRDAFGRDETTNANPFQDQSRFPHRTAHTAHGLSRIDQNASFGMITLSRHIMKIDYIQHPGPGQVNAMTCESKTRSFSVY